MIVKLFIFGLVSIVLIQEGTLGLPTTNTKSCRPRPKVNVPQLVGATGGTNTTDEKEDLPEHTTESKDEKSTSKEEHETESSGEKPKDKEEDKTESRGEKPKDKEEHTPAHSKPGENKTELPCEKKLKWYRDTTSKAQELFDKYYEEYKNLTHSKDKLKDVEAKHSEFKEHVDTALERFQTDAKKIYNISDDSARLAFCRKEMDWFQVLDKNLTGVATNMKNDLLGILGALGVPKETIDSLDKVLSRIVNFLFILDMTKNLFKDVKSLADEAFKVTDEGVKLEKEQGGGKGDKETDKGHETNEDGKVEEAEEAIDHHIDESAYDDDKAEKEISDDIDDIGNNDVDEARDRAIEREEHKNDNHGQAEEDPEEGEEAEEHEIAEEVHPHGK